MASIYEHLAGLAHSRRELAAVKEELQRRYEQWEAENAELIERKKQLEGLVRDLEELVRATAIKIAKETGDKTPAPGVKIRVATRLKYDPKEALDWALSRGMREVLSLNKRAFEKAAKALRPDVVEFVDELQPTIARDLDKALGLEPEIPDGAITQEQVEAEADFAQWVAAQEEGPW